MNDTDPCDCTAGGTPCDTADGERLICDEPNDECDQCAANSDCTDGFSCTNDTCEGVSGTCTSTPDDTNCDDGLFCTDNDVCDPTSDDANATSGCVNDTDPCDLGLDAGGDRTFDICDDGTNACEMCEANAGCDDGIACTTDLCDGISGTCTAQRDDLECGGGEVCDPTQGCVTGDCVVDGDCATTCGVGDPNVCD